MGPRTSSWVSPSESLRTCLPLYVYSIPHSSEYANLRTGDLRFNLPQAVDAYNGTYTVQDFGPACPQQAFDFPEFSGLTEEVIDLLVNTLYDIITPSSEDCVYPFSLNSLFSHTHLLYCHD